MQHNITSLHKQFFYGTTQHEVWTGTTPHVGTKVNNVHKLKTSSQSLKLAQRLCVFLLCGVWVVIVSWRTANPLQDSPTQPPNILSVPPNLRAHCQYIHMCPTSSIDIFWFTDLPHGRLVTTVPDCSGARVLFSWVVPITEHPCGTGSPLWDVNNASAMFVLLVLVAQSHPATMTDT